MKEYELWKIITITMITQLMCIALNISITKYCIEKHSVHPHYGNYKKIDSKERTCEPWDSCE